MKDSNNSELFISFFISFSAGNKFVWHEDGNIQYTENMQVTEREGNKIEYKY